MEGGGGAFPLLRGLGMRLGMNPAIVATVKILDCCHSWEHRTHSGDCLLQEGSGVILALLGKGNRESGNPACACANLIYQENMVSHFFLIKIAVRRTKNQHTPSLSHRNPLDTITIRQQGLYQTLRIG